MFLYAHDKPLVLSCSDYIDNFHVKELFEELFEQA